MHMRVLESANPALYSWICKPREHGCWVVGSANGVFGCGIHEPAEHGVLGSWIRKPRDDRAPGYLDLKTEGRVAGFI